MDENKWFIPSLNNDLFSFLELNKLADFVDVRSHYKSLMLKIHRDKKFVSGSPDAIKQEGLRVLTFYIPILTKDLEYRKLYYTQGFEEAEIWRKQEEEREMEQLEQETQKRDQRTRRPPPSNEPEDSDDDEYFHKPKREIFSYKRTGPPTEFRSMEEVFAAAESPIMLQPMASKAKPERVADAWKRAFNDQSTADVIFSVGNEKLYAHSLFLKFRSEYFQSMFENEWEESKRDTSLLKGVIKIEGFSFHTFKAFMNYLYTESFIEPEMLVDDLLELMQAADYYRQHDLLLACEDQLKTKLTPQNACLIYANAIKFNAKGLQNHSVEFMMSVFKEVVNSVECAQMDSDLKTKLMIKFADLGVIFMPKRMITL